MKTIRMILTVLVPFMTAAHLSAQTKQPEEEVRMVQAYSLDGGTVRKEINVPEGWVYWKHELHQWTANPNLPDSNPHWTKSDGVVRDGSGRITAVFVEVSSVERASSIFGIKLGPRNWIGVDLRVTIRRQPSTQGAVLPPPPPHGRTAGLPSLPANRQLQVMPRR